MLHLEARIVLHNILANNVIQKRAMSGAYKLLGANNKSHALDNQLVILFLRILIWC